MSDKYPNFDDAMGKIGWAIIVIMAAAFIAVLAGIGYLIYIFATQGFS